MVGIANILIYSIAIMICMCLLHDRPRRKMRFEGLRNNKSFGGSLKTISRLQKLLLEINLAKFATFRAFEENCGQKECAK